MFTILPLTSLPCLLGLLSVIFLLTLHSDQEQFACKEPVLVALLTISSALSGVVMIGITDPKAESR